MSEPSSPHAARPSVKLMYLVLFGLMIVAWIVYLAGIAASQQACLDNLNSVTGGGGTFGRLLLGSQTFEDGMGGRRTLLASNSDTCGNYYSFPWWTCWFEVIIIGVAIVSALWGGAHQNVAIIFFAINSAILMVVAGELNSAIFANKDSPNSHVKDIVAANQAAMAGNVMLIVFNLVYLIGATESTGTFAPALGAVTLPSLPKMGAGKAAADAPAQPPLSEPTGAAPPTPSAAATKVEVAPATEQAHTAVHVPAEPSSPVPAASVDGTPKKP